MLDKDKINRIKELKNRSYQRGIFTYTDFLNPTSLAEIRDEVGQKDITVFGGTDFAERKIIRFGSVEEFGYDEPFPITILKLSVKGGKFATKVTHRDVLGAVLNLGIERQKLGDIFINDTFIYVIADEKVSKLILSDLSSVGRNSVEVEEVESVPNCLSPKLETMRFSVASNRADAVVCKVFNLSREESARYFQSGLVSILGRICLQPSKELKEGEVVAVRGLGKFVFLGVDGNSKKGKPYVNIELYK